MAVYRNISPSFWTDARVVDEFTPEDKYFYLYALTNPHGNLCGCYEISIKQMVNETGYNRDTVERLLDRFGAYGLLEYSRETKELLVTNWHKHQWTASPKLDKPLLYHIQRLKCQKFRDYLGEIYNKRKTVSIPYKSGIDTTVSVSVSVSDSVSDTVNNNTVLDITSTDSKRAAREKTKEQEESFFLFWNAYPKKKSKADAEKAFKKLKPDERLLDIMLSTLEEQKRSTDWQRDKGQFIPYPATWLNGRRWEDESGSGNGMPDYSATIPGVEIIDASMYD